MLSAICFNLDQSKILSSGNGLSTKLCWKKFILCELLYIYRCGSTDGAYGPVFNPWKFKFKYKDGEKINRYDIISNNNTERHASQATEERNSQISDPADIITSDRFNELFISGGSSGGSAVAVATGCCFGYVKYYW